MLVVVSELLSAKRTYEVGRARLRLFDYCRTLLLRSKLLRLFCEVLEKLLIQKSVVLLCKFAFFLQLKDRCAQGSPDIE